MDKQRAEFLARIRWLANVFNKKLLEGQAESYWEYLGKLDFAAVKTAIAAAPAKHEWFPSAEKLASEARAIAARRAEELATQRAERSLPPPGGAKKAAADALQARLTTFAWEDWTDDARAELTALVRLLARSCGVDERAGGVDLADRHVAWWQRDGRGPGSLASHIGRWADKGRFPSYGYLSADEPPQEAEGFEPLPTDNQFEQLALEWGKDSQSPPKAEGKSRIRLIRDMVSARTCGVDAAQAVDVPL